LLAQAEQGLSARDVASAFSQGRRAEGKVQDVLRTLAMLGQAAQTGERFLLTAR
jgi:hypothetical protein